MSSAVAVRSTEAWASRALTVGLQAPGSNVDPWSTEILQRLADPIFVLDRQGYIQFRNTAAAQLLAARLGLLECGGRLLLGVPRANAELGAILSRESESLHSDGVAQAFRLPRRGPMKDWLVLVTPLGAEGHEHFCPQSFLVQLVGRLYPRDLPGSLLRSLFCLTRREVEVVASVIRHDSLRSVAVQLGISHETVRAHLRQIFRKCDVCSRLELIATLQKICMFGGAGDASRKRLCAVSGVRPLSAARNGSGREWIEVDCPAPRPDPQARDRKPVVEAECL